MIQITPYTLRLLFSYVNQMRDAQKDYFRTKSQVFLSQAIKYEKKADRLLAALSPLVQDWDGDWDELGVSQEVYEAQFQEGLEKGGAADVVR